MDTKGLVLGLIEESTCSVILIFLFFFSTSYVYTATPLHLQSSPPGKFHLMPSLQPYLAYSVLQEQEWLWWKKHWLNTNKVVFLRFAWSQTHLGSLLKTAFWGPLRTYWIRSYRDLRNLNCNRYLRVLWHHQRVEQRAPDLNQNIWVLLSNFKYLESSEHIYWGCSMLSALWNKRNIRLGDFLAAWSRFPGIALAGSLQVIAEPWVCGSRNLTLR